MKLIYYYEWSVKWKMVFNPGTNKADKLFLERELPFDIVSYLVVDVIPGDFHKHLGFVFEEL